MSKLAFLLSLIFASALVAAPLALKLKSLQLKDQFGKQHRIDFPRQHMTIVTIADEKGAGALDPWLAALKQRYGTNVHYVGIAQVRDVPSLLRPLVTARFKKKYTYPILLDWSGEVIKIFEAKAAAPNIYLVSKDGSLLHHAHGAMQETALENFPIVAPASAPLTARQ